MTLGRKMLINEEYINEGQYSLNFSSNRLQVIVKTAPFLLFYNFKCYNVGIYMEKEEK